MATSWFADHTPSESFPIYSRANCAEVFPDPVSPLTMDYSWPGAGDAGLRRWMFRFCVDPEELDDYQNVMFEVYNAYMFINASVSRLMGARMPGMTVEMIDAAYFGTETQMPDYVPREKDDDPALQEMAGQAALRFMTTTEIPPHVGRLREEVDRFVEERPDISKVDEVELLARLRVTAPLFEEIFEWHSEASTAAGVVLGALTAITMGLERPGLDARIAGAIGEIDSAAPSWALWELSRLVAESAELDAGFEAGIDGLVERLGQMGPASEELQEGLSRFSDEFGSRGPNEWEMRSPSWETAPDLVLTLIDRMRVSPATSSPEAGHQRARAASDQAIAEVRSALSESEEALGAFEAALVSTRIWTATRERTKTTIVKVVHEGRLAALEMGRRLASDGRLADPNHIFMLRDDELEVALAGPSLASECTRRDAQFNELADFEPPFVWEGEPPPLDSWPHPSETTRVAAAGAGETFVGLGGSAGSVTGRARVITDPLAGADLEPGDILVAPLTDPSWTPLFVPAAAVVVDVGGMMGHAVIVSRELGIPCVVAVVDGTRRIPDGATITVDGDSGTVTVESV
jgi:phosphohistidine swiveling domain-containing protein